MLVRLFAVAALAASSCFAQTIVIENAVLRVIDEAQVTALSAGAIGQIHAREGDVIEAGQTLATLEDATERLGVARAEVEARIAQHAATADVAVRFAEKSAEVARAELRRSEESVARFARSVSQSQLDVERLAIDRAELEAEKARHEQDKARLEAVHAEKELELARLLLDRRQMRSPLAGVVVETTARRGEWLEPGQTALRVVATERLLAEGYVAADAARRLRRGQPVSTGESIGRLTFVSPEVDPVTGQVRVLAEITNRDGRRRPGERVTLLVETDRSVDRVAEQRAPRATNSP